MGKRWEPCFRASRTFCQDPPISIWKIRPPQKPSSGILKIMVGRMWPRIGDLQDTFDSKDEFLEQCQVLMPLGLVMRGSLWGSYALPLFGQAKSPILDV